MVKTRRRGTRKKIQHKDKSNGKQRNGKPVEMNMPTVELLVRRIVRSNIGAPSPASIEKNGALKQMIRISKNKVPSGPLVLRMSNLSKKPVNGFGVRLNVGSKKKKEGLDEVLGEFKQRKKQKTYFKIAQDIVLSLARYYGLKDTHMGSEVSLGFMTRDGSMTEIGSRDLFLYGRKEGTAKKYGFSVEVESELRPDSIKKLLYALHDTLHVPTENGIEHMSLVHHIILTKDVKKYMTKALSLDKFDITNGEPRLDGRFNVGDELGHMMTKPERIRELINVIKSLKMSDEILFKDVFGGTKINNMLLRLGGIKKKIELGKTPTKKEIEYLANALEKTLKMNYLINGIDFTITEEIINHLKNDKKFIQELAEYVTKRSFPSSLRWRIIKEMKENSTLSDVTLKEALDYLAGHARKTLQRTVIIVVPSHGQSMKSPDISRARIITFSRVGEEYKLVPKVITMNNYKDTAWKEELAMHAKEIDKRIQETGRVDLRYRPYIPLDDVDYMHTKGKVVKRERSNKRKRSKKKSPK